MRKCDDLPLWTLAVTTSFKNELTRATGEVTMLVYLNVLYSNHMNVVFSMCWCDVMKTCYNILWQQGIIATQ